MKIILKQASTVSDGLGVLFFKKIFWKVFLNKSWFKTIVINIFNNNIYLQAFLMSDYIVLSIKVEIAIRIKNCKLHVN